MKRLGICKLYKMTKELTIERLAEAIIQTKKEVMYLKTELEKVQAYLREQHKLKKQLNNK
tara:strand:+ start:11126 stop:11305 length:180 start_codon:yes stop_codon:yes gene_type:complete